MKPINLKIAGFKSFREEQEIDFERLAQNNIFGITGTTGSGKTSVLDAIILALYGGLNKDGGNTDKYKFINLNCNKAELEFTFSPAGNSKRYCVRRVFSTDAKSPDSVLYELDGNIRTAVVSGERQVTAAITEILGLSLKEFTQVIVLQQGEFARFLRLGTKDRSDLIGSIFSLDKFGQELSNKLSARIKELTRERTRLSTLVATYNPLTEAEVNKREAELKKRENEFEAEVTANAEKRREAIAAADAVQAELIRQEAALAQSAKLSAEIAAEKARLSKIYEDYRMADNEGKRCVALSESLTELRVKVQADADAAAAAFEGYVSGAAATRAFLSEASAFLSLAQKTADAANETMRELAAAEKEFLQRTAEISTQSQKQALLLAGQEESRKTCEELTALIAALERESGEVATATNLIIETCGEGAECPVCGGIIAHGNLKNIAPQARERYTAARENLKREKVRLERFAAQIPSESVKIEAMSAALEDCRNRTQKLRQKAAQIVPPPPPILRQKFIALGKLLQELEDNARALESAKVEAGTADVKRNFLRQEGEAIRERIAGLKSEILPDYAGRAAEIKAGLEAVKARRAEAEEMFRKEENMRRSALAGERAGLRTLRENSEKGLAAKRELASVDKSYAAAETLSGLLYGKRLLNFVVDGYIRSFTQRASRHLNVLKGGQYVLEYDDEFLVIDNFNDGRRRHADTLSGGETFLVSLALALAISEEIADTRRFEFFFIDEGFGTLDDELRETVVDALEALKEEHFNIGFISHSRELMERLVVKLRVVAADESGGSRVFVE